MKNTPKNNDLKEIEFTAEKSGGLLELAKAELKGLSPGKVKSYLKYRMMSVEGYVTSQFDFPVKQGQKVKIKLSGRGGAKPPLKIIYEDNALLAVNKPAGLLSVASDTEKEKTAVRLMREAGIEPIFVVHRLDRDTSGVLLFAKSPEIRDKIQENWNTSALRREYLAICEGTFEKKSGRCDTLLRETDTHLVYSASYGDGKRAITNYMVLGENEKYSLLRVSIETGRKNQIRVHMKELSHPIIGDKKYGAKTNPLGRLGLHASILELIHPVTGLPLIIKAERDSSFRLPKES